MTTATAPAATSAARRLIDGHQSEIAWHMTAAGAAEDYAASAAFHLWDRVARRIATVFNLSRDEADDRLADAIDFITAGGGTPTKRTDSAWETLMLYTMEYAALCQVITGRFVHHRPNDVPGFMRPAAEACNRPCSSDCD